MTATAEKSALRELWEKAAPSLAGAELPWIDRLRVESIERFEELGFPTPELEDWRFTRVDPVAKAKLRLPAPQPAPRELPVLSSLDADRLVFVDGLFSREHSTPAPRGVAVGTMLGFLKAEPARLQPYLGRLLGAKAGAFAALNAALFSDGAVLLLPKGAALKRPLHLVFFTRGAAEPVASHTRVLIVAERGSRASIVEEHVGSGPAYLGSSVAELYLDDDSSIELTRLLRASSAAWSYGALRARVGRSARLWARTVSLGGALSRDEIVTTLEGEGAACRLDGLFLAGGERHDDHWTRIVHAAPHGTSNALYKGVLKDRARAVFNGTVEVAPGASGADGKIYNKNLLLSEGALVNTKPEFKIFNNDVQCRHGATIGQLSADALFYLRSRGISAEEARSLLVNAFTAETLAGEPIEALREAIAGQVRAWLEDRR